MRDLRVTMVQSMLHWEDAGANRAMFGEMLKPLEGATDLVVLPEMFTTGFTMRSVDMAENMDGPTVDWMRAMSSEIGAAIYGSIIIQHEGRSYNRGLFVQPSGHIAYYDKRHLFRMAEEHHHFSPGRERVVVEYLGWRILPQVCYDLRFPVFSRNRNDHDLALYVANWPQARRYPWSQLLIARAIENQIHVVGVNRVGMDGKGIHYSGDSVVINARGEIVQACTVSQEEMITTTLSIQELIEFREKFPAFLDADGFELKL